MKKVDETVTEEKFDGIKSLEKSEKFFYGILITLCIAFIPFISYLKSTAFLVFPFILILEFIGFLFIKNVLAKKSLEEIASKTKKVKLIKYTVYTLFTVDIVGLAAYLVYIVKNLVENNAFGFFYQVLTLNVIPFVMFIFLILLIFNFQDNNESKDDSKQEDKVLMFKNEKENVKLERLIYVLFTMITCVIPFLYAFLTNESIIRTNIWVIGCLSNLIFGVLTSLLLRYLKYNRISYNILSLVLMFMCLIGCVTKVTSFVIGYILFLVSLAIAFTLLKFYDKKPKDCAYLMSILLILLILLLPKWM